VPSEEVDEEAVAADDVVDAPASHSVSGPSIAGASWQHQHHQQHSMTTAQMPLLPLVLQQASGRDPPLDSVAGGNSGGGESGQDGEEPCLQDASLYEIGRKCIELRELILCGAVHPSTVDWLRRNTAARIDYMEGGICGSLYTEEPAVDDAEQDPSW
jgi:hypothetical protein